MALTDDPQGWITSVIRDFIEHSPENSLHNPENEKAFEEVLVGFSGGADPVYQTFHEHVGPFHWTPQEIFGLTFPQSAAPAGDLTVISWVLPQRKVTKADNRREKAFPAERWARARIFGEALNEKLRTHVVEMLGAEGIEALAPMLSPHFKVKASDRFVMASTWSERHAAFASGLGTFGLCDGLITPKGKAMRVGSVIARITVPPTPRPYTDHHAYCLFYAKGICGKCITRCPAGALSKKGHDKIKCRAYLKPKTENYVKTRYGFDGYGCGLCQTGVPCESKIPLANDVETF